MSEPTTGRRERKKEETKNRIFVAAAQLFHEKGFDATTVDEIAERADVSKGTFFNYFPRKEALGYHLAEEWLREIEQAAAESERSAEERITELFAMGADSYGENRELARVVARYTMQQLCAPSPEAVGTQRRMNDAFDAIWVQGQQQGEFRMDIEPMMARGVLGAVFIGAVMWWVGSPEGRVDPDALRFTLPDLIRLHCRTVFDGLRRRETRA
jgi:AcrR family transcriptional regulator